MPPCAAPMVALAHGAWHPRCSSLFILQEQGRALTNVITRIEALVESTSLHGPHARAAATRATAAPRSAGDAVDPDTATDYSAMVHPAAATWAAEIAACTAVLAEVQARLQA